MLHGVLQVCVREGQRNTLISPVLYLSSPESIIILSINRNLRTPNLVDTVDVFVLKDVGIEGHDVHFLSCAVHERSELGRETFGRSRGRAADEL